uniref:Uncharacterized protein n=1 Tax=Anguilla anguilla TaxID=7936 RepID=A0A0E9SMJ9_ANGAN
MQHSSTFSLQRKIATVPVFNIGLCFSGPG